jgi:hypothetical protein
MQFAYFGNPEDRLDPNLLDQDDLQTGSTVLIS